MSLEPIGSPDDRVLAAEYVLHLLDPEERAAAEERLAVDGGFRAAVADWTEDLASLAEEIDPVTPPASVRQALAARFGTETAPEAGAVRRRRSFGGLFGALVGGLAAVLVLTLVLPEVQGPPEPGPVYAAQIAGQGSGLLFDARFDPSQGLLTLDRQSGAAPEGRVLELWLIAGENAPVSLGVLPDGPLAEFTLPESLASGVPGGTLALSEEPPGGSPTGAPTGEVLAAGQVSDA